MGNFEFNPNAARLFLAHAAGQLQQRLAQPLLGRKRFTLSPRSESFQRAKTNHFFLLFIVQAYSQQAEARPDCYRFDCREGQFGHFQFARNCISEHSVLPADENMSQS